MSDACILCDENVPRSAPHFAVQRRPSMTSINDGVLCDDVVACVQRAIFKFRSASAVRRTDWQRGIHHDAVQSGRARE